MPYDSYDRRDPTVHGSGTVRGVDIQECDSIAKI